MTKIKICCFLAVAFLIDVLTILCCNRTRRFLSCRHQVRRWLLETGFSNFPASTLGIVLILNSFEERLTRLGADKWKHISGCTCSHPEYWMHHLTRMWLQGSVGDRHVRENIMVQLITDLISMVTGAYFSPENLCVRTYLCTHTEVPVCMYLCVYIWIHSFHFFVCVAGSRLK